MENGPNVGLKSFRSNKHAAATFRFPELLENVNGQQTLMENKSKNLVGHFGKKFIT